MKSRSLLPAGAALAFTIMACQPGAGPLSDEDIAAIRANGDAYAQSALSADWPAWAALFTDDAVNMAPNEPAIEGRPAIQAWGEAFPTMTEFTSTPVEIDGRTDLAYIRGTYSYTATVEGAPEPVTDSGKYLVVLRKQADGSWLTTANIWNSDQPLPE